MQRDKKRRGGGGGVSFKETVVLYRWGVIQDNSANPVEPTMRIGHRKENKK